MYKHDISAELVRIDYDSLCMAVRAGAYALRNNVERAMSEIQHNDWSSSRRSMKITARNMAESAEAFANAVETLEALEASATRNQLVVVNRPNCK